MGTPHLCQIPLKRLLCDIPCAKNKRWGLFAGLASLGTLGAVLGTALHTAGNALGVQSTADDVITHTRQVLDTAASDHNDRVLLQVMTDAGDIAPNLHAIGQTDTGDLAQRRIRLLGGHGLDRCADTALLG